MLGYKATHNINEGGRLRPRKIVPTLRRFRAVVGQLFKRALAQTRCRYFRVADRCDDNSASIRHEGLRQLDRQIHSTVQAYHRKPSFSSTFGAMRIHHLYAGCTV